MEASTKAAAPANLEGDKAQRIIAAMRESIAARGAAASTFDVVAREAGVSRGLLHYYFGSKERLLVEVTRRDCDERIAALEAALSGAGTVDEIVDMLVASMKRFVYDDPAGRAVVYEMLTAARHSAEIRAELAELYRRWREHLAAALEAKQKEGVIDLPDDSANVAATLFALGDGFAVQMGSDPDWNAEPAIDLASGAVRRLLGARE